MSTISSSLAEMDERKLYLGEGCSSLFTYCTQLLHLSEHAAYGRSEAARASRQFPIILDLLAEGSITLTAVGLLRRHLTEENCREILAEAHHKSKRDIEHLIARLQPRPAVPSSVRKLPTPKPPIVVKTVQADAPSSSRAASTSDLTRPPVPLKCLAVLTPLAPDGTRSSSPLAAGPTKSCAVRRTCCGTPSPAATQPQSSIER